MNFQRKVTGVDAPENPLNLSEDELALRREAYGYAKASVELEGFKVSDEVEELLIAKRDGHITGEELLTLLDERNKAFFINGKRQKPR